MPEISQEELDKLRASANIGPLGAPEGEGLAARSIADYLRGGGTRQGAPLGGGGLSYGGNTSGTPDFRTLAAARGQARDAGASISELQAVDAQQRQQNEQNPFGLNNKQNKALELAWQSSPDRKALEATNAQRTAQGLPPLNSTFGQNYYHTNQDGSRDYNYSKEGTYRGETPSQFATGDPNNPYAAHFNNDTGQWEAGDLSLMQTFKDIGSGFKDAYGNIRNTIPQMGAEVVSGFKDLYGNLTGKKEAEATPAGPLSADNAYLQSLGLDRSTAANSAAANKAIADRDRAAATHSGATNSQGRALSKTVVAAPTSRAISDARAAASAAANNNRNKQSAGSQQLAAKTRAQLASVKSGSGGALHGGGRNDGGYIHRNYGGPISAYNVGGIAQSNLREEQIQQQQRAANAPQIASPGGGGGGIKDQIGKKVIGSLLGSATGGLGSMLGGLFNDGGLIPQHKMAGGQMMDGAVHRNMGGPLANPNGYNEGGAASETPIKKVMDEQKLAQQAKAFDLEQGRKQEAHDMAMKQKKQAFSEAQKMKKASATTKMKPKAPLGAK